MAEINQNSTLGNESLRLVLESILTDITAIRSGVNVAISKLNADGGVSDTDYAAITALTTTS